MMCVSPPTARQTTLYAPGASGSCTAKRELARDRRRHGVEVLRGSGGIGQRRPTSAARRRSNVSSTALGAGTDASAAGDGGLQRRMRVRGSRERQRENDCNQTFHRQAPREPRFYARNARRVPIVERLGRLATAVVWWPPTLEGDTHADRRSRRNRAATSCVSWPRAPCSTVSAARWPRRRCARPGRRGPVGRARFRRRHHEPGRKPSNVWDFEAAIRKSLNAGHYAYIAQGSDDLGTIAANRAGFQKIGLRPRRLVDVGTVDLVRRRVRPTLELADHAVPRRRAADVPPRGRSRRRARRQDQERAADAVDRHELCPSRTSPRRAAGPGWFQLYSTSDWPATRAHAEARRGRRLHGRRLDRRHSGAQPRSRSSASIATPTPSARRATPACRPIRSRCGACSTAST